MNAWRPAFVAAAAAAMSFAAVAAEPGAARPLPLALPAAVANQIVHLNPGTRQAVERLRDEESAAAQRVRGAAPTKPPGASGLVQAPRIDAVNGKPMAQVAFTPGATYVIQGSGFGSTPGQVRVTGPFPGGALPAAVELWQDTLVVLRVSPLFGGVPDRNGVGVEVRPSAGPSVALGGARFVAAREIINVGRLPSSRMHWGGVAPVVEAAAGPAIRVKRHAQPIYEGMPPRLVAGQPCFGPGSDDYDLAGLDAGFVLAGYQWGYVLPQPGSANTPWNPDTIDPPVVEGSFRVEATPAGLRVRWAAVTYVTHNLLLTGCKRSDSEYAITFKLEGPRGVNPFAGLAASVAGVQAGN